MTCLPIKAKSPLFAYFFIILLSVYLVFIMGYPLRFDRIILTGLSLLLLLQWRFFKILIVITFLLAALYIPISYYYGYPNVGIIVALCETNHEESSEFISQMPYLVWLVTLVSFITFIGFFFYVKLPRASAWWLFLMMLLLLCYKPVKLLYSKPWQDISVSRVVDEVRWPIFEFYRDGVDSYLLYRQEKAKHLEQIQQVNQIPILSVAPTHKVYVVVIGESVRKDYMQLYGYPANNTPFVSEKATLVWDGLISPSPNTQGSLPVYLAQTTIKDQSVEITLNNNIVSIANQAGYDTYWLSNQGRLGDMETTMPRITLYAQNIFYNKLGAYNGKQAQGKFDTDLLPELINYLRHAKNDKTQFIVLHLMGSHPRFCKRLQFPLQFEHAEADIACYLSSIKETDDLLKSVVEAVEQYSQNDYALLYFSDHGLAHTDNQTDLRHNDQYKQSYQVPFFIIDSKQTEPRFIERTISGFNFMSLLAKWSGITLAVDDPYMQHALPDIPAQEHIKVLDGHKEFHLFDSLKDDSISD